MGLASNILAKWRIVGGSGPKGGTKGSGTKGSGSRGSKKK